MSFGALLIAGGLMAVLGVGLSGILAIANKTLHVLEDPRIDVVESMLPGANCGACSFPGCRAAAEKIVAGEGSPSMCTANSAESAAAIAAFLGVAVGAQAKRVARLACAGGKNVARTRALYTGIDTCRAATLIAGGGKGCAWGCLGYGDCSVACPFNAISMNEFSLPEVDGDKCTACGACVDACPKGLFSIHPESHRLWVACKNEAVGRAAISECEVACIGCGRCAVDATPGVIEIVRNLARVDYRQNSQADIEAIQGCPTGAIVWLDDEGRGIKGARAKQVVRKTMLPVG